MSFTTHNPLQYMKNNDTDYKYFTIPLKILQRIYTHPKTAFDDIIHVGIYKTSSYQNLSIDHALQQLMYCYYREELSLTASLKNLLDDLIKNEQIYLNEDYNGFNDDEFLIEVEDLQGLYEVVENNKDIKEQILIWHGVRQTQGMLNINFKGEAIPNTILAAERVMKELPTCNTLVTVKTSMMFNYRNEKKTAEEIDLLVCYLAVRSIIGYADFTWTNKQAILKRMIGCNSLVADKSKNKEFTDILRIKELKKVYDRYSTNHKISTLLDNAVLFKFFTKIGVKPLRRTYISTKLNHEELTEAIIKNGSKSNTKKIADNKKKEQKAANAILQSLKG